MGGKDTVISASHITMFSCGFGTAASSSWCQQLSSRRRSDKDPETAALLRKHGGKSGEELKGQGKLTNPPLYDNS
jgi:hypothetical protein